MARSKNIFHRRTRFRNRRREHCLVIAKRYTALASLALLTQTPNLFAQQAAVTAPVVKPPAAAAVAPAAAKPPATVAPAAAPATAPAPTTDATVLATREAPTARNQVTEAFVPQSGGLTANDVAKRAVASSNTIAAKNAELRAAAAEVDNAMYQFLPKVTLKAGYTRLSRVVNSMGNGSLLATQGTAPFHIGPLDPTNPNSPQGLVSADGQPVGGAQIKFPIITDVYSLTASLNVPLSDYVLRMSQSIEGTKQNREAAELNIQAEHAKVEGDARVAFFNWARAIGQVAVTEKSIDRVKARLKDAEAAFTVGLVTKAEVLRLQALVAATEAGLETAKGFRDLSAQQLSVIMNDKNADYVLGEDVLAIPATRPIEPLEQLVAEAHQRRLELQSLNHTVKSLENAESVVRAGQLPRLDGFADYTYANPNSRYTMTTGWHGTWSAGVSLSYTINELLMSGASANKFKANRETVEANRNAVAQGIRMEVASAYTDGRRAAAELEAAKRAAEASQAAYDTSIQLYRVGKATTAELIDSEAELVNSNLRLINAHIDTKVAETKLTRAIGRDLTKVGH
jgi:outer membrane protein TolC